jgi:chromosome segregation ATPase
MLDEFAGLAELKSERDDVVEKLHGSAEQLRPLYEERENLKSQLTALEGLRKELASKEKLIPDEEEEQRWAQADGVADEIEGVVEALQGAAAAIPRGPVETDAEESEWMAVLFGQDVPAVGAEEIAQCALLQQWAGKVRAAVDAITKAREGILTAVATLQKESQSLRQKWLAARKSRQDHVRAALAKVQVDSPAELVNRVKQLRRQVTSLEKVSKPRLITVEKSIARGEAEHEGLVGRLQKANRELSRRRREKAEELTASLEGQIKVEVIPQGNRDEYELLLNDLCEEISTQEHRISKRQGQIEKIVETMGPIKLARAL